VTAVVVRRERVIPLPIDVVWQLVEPVESLPAWLPFVVRSQIVGGRGLGRRQRVTATWGGRRLEIDQEVVEYRPNQTLAWTHVAERPGGRAGGGAASAVTMRVSMESAGPGTLVAIEVRQTPASFAERLAFRLLGRRRIAAGFDRALKTLADVGG
jgi:uncharacterized membrane protein